MSFLPSYDSFLFAPRTPIKETWLQHKKHQQQILTFISQCLGYPVQGSVTDVRIVGNTEILQVWISQAVEVRLTASPSCKQVSVTITQCNWEQDLPVASTPWKLLFKIFK